jgi:hypothetical protein
MAQGGPDEEFEEEEAVRLALSRVASIYADQI